MLYDGLHGVMNLKQIIEPFKAAVSVLARDVQSTQNLIASLPGLPDAEIMEALAGTAEPGLILAVLDVISEMGKATDALLQLADRLQERRDKIEGRLTPEAAAIISMLRRLGYAVIVGAGADGCVQIWARNMGSGEQYRATAESPLTAAIELVRMVEAKAAK